MIRNDDSQSKQVHALLLEFVDLGRRLKQLKVKASPEAMREHQHIIQRVHDVARKVVRLSETMDPCNEYLQIFSVAAILASDITDDPQLEKCLMELALRVSRRKSH